MSWHHEQTGPPNLYPSGTALHQSMNTPGAPPSEVSQIAPYHPPPSWVPQDTPHRAPLPGVPQTAPHHAPLPGVPLTAPHHAPPPWAPQSAPRYAPPPWVSQATPHHAPPGIPQTAPHHAPPPWISQIMPHRMPFPGDPQTTPHIAPPSRMAPPPSMGIIPPRAPQASPSPRVPQPPLHGAPPPRILPPPPMGIHPPRMLQAPPPGVPPQRLPQTLPHDEQQNQPHGVQPPRIPQVQSHGGAMISPRPTTHPPQNTLQSLPPHSLRFGMHSATCVSTTAQSNSLTPVPYPAESFQAGLQIRPPHPTGNMRLPSASIPAQNTPVTNMLQNIPRPGLHHMRPPPRMVPPPNNMLRPPYTRPVAPPQSPMVFPARSLTPRVDPSQETSSVPDESHNSQSEHSEREKQKSADAMWLQNFVRHKKLSYPEKTAENVSRHIMIPEARGLMKEALGLQDKLQNLLGEAENTTDENNHDIYQQFIKIKARLDELEAVISDERFISDLQAKVARIKRKRAGQKRRRERATMEEEETLKRKKDMEARIDQWQADIARKSLEAKKANELKAAADKVLGEVRLKQLETVKGQDLLRALAKLRDIRCLKMEQKGVYVTQTSEELFQKRRQGLEDLWQRQLAVYMEEDKALRVIMDMEQEESLDREREQAMKKDERKLRIYRRAIKELLFGKEGMVRPDDPMYSFRQYHESGLHDLQSFIRIRHDWDVHIMKEDIGGSSLPVGWVRPVEPSNPVWATTLKDNQPHS